jgi:outer membrane receptor for ferrienterochelin and colicin
MSEANIEYGAEYQYDGKTWGITYFAKDEEDAIAKLESITEQSQTYTTN